MAWQKRERSVRPTANARQHSVRPLGRWTGATFPTAAFPTGLQLPGTPGLLGVCAVRTK
jgi:hypothetical protein